jgi:hypothetical protein
MGPQQKTLDALADERARLLNACVVDMDRVDRVEKAYAYLIVQITEARLVKTN